MSDLLRADKEFIWHPFTPLLGSPDPIVIKSAKGIYLHTEDGREIIDGISSWWVNLHGHSHPKIAEALYQQAKELEHVIFAGFTHAPAVNLAKALLEILPSSQTKIFFSDNGSTAVEVGLKMAIQYWHNSGINRKRIIAFEGAYHGDTFGAMSAGDRGIFTKPFHTLLFPVEFIPWPDGSNHAQVIAQLQKLIHSGDVATFIYEPLVQGAAGMRICQPEILDQLLSIAREADVICIADEVFTGFGRTGENFASDHLVNKPDIIALSKGLTGGMMPMGITSCSQKIQDAFRSEDFDKTFFHGHSFAANPLGCAVAMASLELLQSSECRQSIEKISQAQWEFKEKIKRHSSVSRCDSLGSILSIAINAGTPGYENELRKRIYRFFIDRNILLRPLGNVIYFLPSYAFTAADLQKVHNSIEKFLDHFSAYVLTPYKTG